jgi:hypothetical protein
VGASENDQVLGARYTDDAGLNCHKMPENMSRFLPFLTRDLGDRPHDNRTGPFNCHGDSSADLPTTVPELPSPVPRNGWTVSGGIAGTPHPTSKTRRRPSRMPLLRSERAKIHPSHGVGQPHEPYGRIVRYLR